MDIKNSLTPTGHTIYVEKELREDPRALKIINKFKHACVIECNNYREIFNPRRNNFRLQKNHPALIIARKEKNLLHSSPYSLGGQHNFYFSHFLNCIYDCSYCFLQALYSSAHYVIFINYEDFFYSIEKKIMAIKDGQESFFFSGYDGDSLAYEPISGFAESALSFFTKFPNAWLELRTKSVQIKTLIQKKAIPNCIVAFSMAPHCIAKEYEKSTPSCAKRLMAMHKLVQHNWQIGIRLDPLIWHEQWQDSYAELIKQIGNTVPEKYMHSITLGTLRYPRSIAAKMVQHYPTSGFLVKNMIVTDSALQMQDSVHKKMTNYCREHLTYFYDEHKIFDNSL